MHGGYWSVSCHHRALLPVRVTGKVRGQGEGSVVCFASAPGFVCSSALHFSCILSFNVILFPLEARCGLRHFPLPHALSFFFLPSSRCSPNADMLSFAVGKPHTRIDLTISAIQPPKSNYHGHNTVIKSNGLVDEAPTWRQNKSFSSQLHIILSVPLPGTTNSVHSSPRALCNSTFIFFLYRVLKFLKK